MNRLRWLLGIGLISGALGWLRAAEPPALIVRGLSEEGMVEFDEQTGTATDPAGVEVRYEKATLTARTVRIDRATGEIAAEGGVRLQDGRELWTGERLRYNFSSRDLGAEQFRSGMTPFFVSGEGLTASVTNRLHSATNAVITTDDLYTPSYRIRARSIRIVPGEYIEAKGATLYLGKVPVMYFPTYRSSLRYHRNFWVVTPGYRNRYGGYLLNAYHWNITTNFEAVFNFDYRIKRGLGGGPDFNYDLGRAGVGQIKSYYTYDNEPDQAPDERPIDPERYRLNFAHSTFVTSNLTAKAAVRWQSDATVIRDFFETEYRQDVQPKSFLEVNQSWPNFSLNLLAVAQVNDFFQTIERLPDLKLSAARQQLGLSPFYYESDTSAAYLRYRSNEQGSTNYAAFRGDTFHELLLPQTFFGWLNVAPRVGGRFTYYGAFDDWGEPDGDSSRERWVFNTGAEISTKASRIWPSAHSRLLAVTSLRHIIEPSVNYVYVPTPNFEPGQLPQFDYEWQTFELLPVDFPDYNAVDSVDANNVFRLGLRNKLQTKRGEAVDNLVNWYAVMDWRADPRANQRTFSDFYSDLDFKPRSWLTLNSEIRFDVNEGQWNMANHTLTIQPNTTWNWKVGHRYLRELPGYGPESGNDLFLSSLFVRLNENWALRLTHHFEARDSVMEEQYYTVYRDFRSWTGALTLRLRDNRQLGEDWTVAFSFSLKAFPRFKLGQDRDSPSLLLGG